MSASKGTSDLTAGLVITLVGVLFIPIIASFQGVATAQGSSGDPNLTGANLTLAENILTFYLIGYILTLIFTLVLPAVRGGARARLIETLNDLKPRGPTETPLIGV